MKLKTLILTLFVLALPVKGQELNARVSINHQQVQGTSTSIFEDLEKNLTTFINERAWTNLQFQRLERIPCSFSITVKKYDESENTFQCTLNVQAQRPVYNASYTSVFFATSDGNFNFEYKEFDQLEFRPELIDNDLTALVGYYVYLIIGWNLDTMSPLGGTEVLQTAKTICSNATSLTHSAKGWKAFDDGKNRYGIINDLLDGGMEDFRQMQYKYYRDGLDQMAENSDRGRAGILESFDLLEKARDNRPQSMVPQLFTEFKRDEITYVFKGKGSTSEKTKLYDLLMKINASQSSYWNQIK